MYFNNSDKEQQSSVSSPHTPTADINDFSFKDLEEGDLYCPIINEDDVEDPVCRKIDSKLPYIIIGKKIGHSTISYTDNPELPFSRREMRLCDKLSGNTGAEGPYRAPGRGYFVLRFFFICFWRYFVFVNFFIGGVCIVRCFFFLLAR
jgi:hypothetical protein